MIEILIYLRLHIIANVYIYNFICLHFCENSIRCYLFNILYYSYTFFTWVVDPPLSISLLTMRMAGHSSASGGHSGPFKLYLTVITDENFQGIATIKQVKFQDGSARQIIRNQLLLSILKGSNFIKLSACFLQIWGYQSNAWFNFDWALFIAWGFLKFFIRGYNILYLNFYYLFY